MFAYQYFYLRLHFLKEYLVVFLYRLQQHTVFLMAMYGEISLR